MFLATIATDTRKVAVFVAIVASLREINLYMILSLNFSSPGFNIFHYNIFMP